MKTTQKFSLTISNILKIYLLCWVVTLAFISLHQSIIVATLWFLGDAAIAKSFSILGSFASLGMIFVTLLGFLTTLLIGLIWLSAKIFGR